MNILFLFFLTFQCSLCLFHENNYYLKQFQSYQAKFGKKYVNQEEQKYRQKIFSESLDEIEKFNSEKHKWKKGINQFSDITAEEFKHRYLSEMKIDKNLVRKSYKSHTLKDKNSQEIDWEQKGVMTPIEDQKECGSCWAFSTMETLQAFNVINYNKEPTQLSKQQLMDCNANHMSCEGGTLYHAYRYTARFPLLCTEEEYPYEAKDNSCRSKQRKCTYENKQRAYEIVESGEEGLRNALQLNPISVSIRADELKAYSSGIFEGDDCPYGALPDHGVVVVGYGKSSEGGEYYYRIKNSWGKTWGEEGYFRLEADYDSDNEFATGACALTSLVVVPSLNISTLKTSSYVAICIILYVLIAIIGIFTFVYTCGFVPEKFLPSFMKPKPDLDSSTNLLSHPNN